MLFKNIPGQEHIKRQLIDAANRGRIPHAQLFIGPEGSGTLSMALVYAQYILCQNIKDENNTQNVNCNLKCERFSHPDLHFVFPVATNSFIKSHPISNLFLVQWHKFLREQPYGNLFDWYRTINIEKKQGLIGVDEAKNILEKLSLKSYESPYKIMLVWMAEKMNNSTANKLLKIIEEPPPKTVFLLIAEQEEKLLKTIRSRCQIVHFSALPQDVIQKTLEKKGIETSKAKNIAHQANGNLNKAFKLENQSSEVDVFEKWFIFWARTSFKAKGNKNSILGLLDWSKNISKSSRETQKQFITYCLEVFRQALMQNYTADKLVYNQFEDESFKFAKFSKFVHQGNIISIVKALEDTAYHIERNGNSEMLFTDLSIKMTRLIHQK